MSDDVNKVFISGRLGADPELRHGQNGGAVLSLRLCSNTSYLDRDKQRKERQTWVTVKVFGKRAEALAGFLGKGQYLVIEGSIETGSYDDRDGNKRTTFDVVASNVVIPPKGDKRQDGGGEPPRGRPQGQRRESPGHAAPPPEPPADDYEQGGYGGSDDPPFIFIGAASETDGIPRGWL